VRRRLITTLVGLVAGALILAGAGTLLVTRSYARSQASHQLLSQAKAIASDAHDARTPRVLAAIRRTLRLEDVVVLALRSDGQVVGKIPPAITTADLGVGRLLAGTSVQGSTGSLVYVAVPVELQPAELRALPPGVHPVVLLIRRIGSLGPGWTYFLLVGAATLVVAAAVSFQLSRRISRPLVEAVFVTGRIAGGELDARVPVRPDDLPELASLASSINVMAANLDGARTRERQLLLSVSHDLRTPLTSIRGFAEAIADGAIDDPSRAASVIIAESKRLERLVEDLLDLAKLEMHRLSLDISPVDANAAASAVVTGLEPQAHERGVTLLLAPPGPGDTSMLVAADGDRLAQVLANLVDNALAFAQASVTVAVFAGAPGMSPGAFVTFAVIDDGPGIEPEDLHRIFDRFYQADRRPGRHLGSGLGLAIVAELVRAMGGSVRAESPLGDAGGTRLLVSLPSYGPVT